VLSAVDQDAARTVTNRSVGTGALSRSVADSDTVGSEHLRREREWRAGALNLLRGNGANLNLRNLEGLGLAVV